MPAKHPDKALNALKIKSAKPGRHADGNGLYLVVDPSGAKRWLLRIVIHNRRRDIGLGSAALVSLAEAREEALAFRKRAREGGDPLADRRTSKQHVPSFAESAEKVHEDQRSSWRNEKHAAQWINTLRQYAFPHMGGSAVDQIGTPEVLKALAPIWLTKPETARRVRQRIATVLDWAKAAGYRSGDNPVEGVERGLPKQSAVNDHHAALPYSDVPLFIQKLRSSPNGEVVRLAFEFLILTAGRTSEVLGARWDEIDTKQELWIVPPIRMKANREHRVPLSARCREILTRMRTIGGSGHYVFPGRMPNTTLSNTVFLMALRRAQVATTGHGFRSSFRDWAAEETNLPREVAEMALAHTIENKVEAAYRRGDLLERNPFSLHRIQRRRSSWRTLVV